MLSELFLSKVYKVLNYKSYRTADFSIEMSNESKYRGFNPEPHTSSGSKKYTGGVSLRIEYRYKKEFFVLCKVFDSNFETVNIKPGRIMRIDSKKNITVQEFLDTLSDWLKTLDDYFSSDPISRNILKTQEKIDKLEKRFDEALGDLNEEFQNDEISSLKEQLTSIEKELTERLNQQIEDKEILQSKIEELHQDLQILKNQVGPLNKKNWLLSYYTKVYLWNQNNPSLLPKSLLHIGHKFLPENLQDVISTEIIDSTVDSFLPESTEEKSKVENK